MEEKRSVEFSEDIGKLFWTLNIDLRQTKKRISRHVIKHPKKESVIKIVAFN